MSNLVQVKEIFGRESVMKNLKAMLGSKAQGFATSVLSAVNNNRLLQSADANSIYTSAMVAASLDLPINPNLGFAAIVPYGRAAQFQIMTRGIIQLAIRSGQYARITNSIVYEGQLVKQDPFTDEYVFDFNAKTSDKVIGYVAYFRTVGGFEKYFYMTKEEVEAHGRKYSKSFSSGVWKTDFDSMALKGLALDTIIPTPDGYTTMGEIKVGDKLFNALGEVTTVIAKSQIKNLPCYEVEFSNGEIIVCDEEHRWFVKNGNGRMEDWSVLETKDMYGVKELGYPIVIPRTEPVKMQEKELTIDPYILGYWLGNGSHGAAMIACHEDDSEEIISRFEKFYVVNTRHDDRSRSMILNISSKTGSRSDMSSLKQQIKHIGVYKNKHIPIDYKRASIEQRIELVRGLCDSDGCIDSTKRGRVSYGSVKRELVEDMYELLCSLGERPSIHSHEARGYGTTTTYHTVQWKPQNFNPFHLKRKAERCKDKLITRNITIKSIRKIDSVPTQCIAVDSGDSKDEKDLRKSFLVGYGFIPTHNTVLKLLLSKYGILSVEMQRAITLDQAEVKGEINTVEDIDAVEVSYIDNPSSSDARREAMREAMNVNTETGEITND